MNEAEYWLTICLDHIARNSNKLNYIDVWCRRILNQCAIDKPILVGYNNILWRFADGSSLILSPKNAVILKGAQETTNKLK